MLVTSRRIGESLHIDENIDIFILDISATKVKLGIRAPHQVRVTRSALLLEVQEQNAAASLPAHLEAALASSAGVTPVTPDPLLHGRLSRPEVKTFLQTTISTNL